MPESNPISKVKTKRQENSILCAALIEVASYHFVQYSLIFNGHNATINTEIELGLTFCSAYLQSTDDRSIAT